MGGSSLSPSKLNFISFILFNSLMFSIRVDLALSISLVSLKNEGYNNLELIKIFLFISLK